MDKLSKQVALWHLCTLRAGAADAVVAGFWRFGDRGGVPATQVTWTDSSEAAMTNCEHTMSQNCPMMT